MSAYRECKEERTSIVGIRPCAYLLVAPEWDQKGLFLGGLVSQAVWAEGRGQQASACLHSAKDGWV